MRNVLFALFVVAAPVAAPSCATVKGGPQALASVDVIDREGRTSTLQTYAGMVVAVDVCASWAEACHLNARAIDAAHRELQGTDARFVTLLLDDLPVEALRAYVDVAGRDVPVVMAGPRTRAGRSVLGDVTGVPRLVVLDRNGVVVLDESGGVLSPEGLVRRVRPLL